MLSPDGEAVGKSLTIEATTAGFADLLRSRAGVLQMRQPVLLTALQIAAGGSVGGETMVNVARCQLAHKRTASFRDADAGQLHLRVSRRVL